MLPGINKKRSDNSMYGVNRIMSGTSASELLLITDRFDF